MNIIAIITRAHKSNPQMIKEIGIYGKGIQKKYILDSKGIIFKTDELDEIVTFEEIEKELTELLKNNIILNWEVKTEIRKLSHLYSKLGMKIPDTKCISVSTLLQHFIGYTVGVTLAQVAEGFRIFHIKNNIMQDAKTIYEIFVRIVDIAKIDMNNFETSLQRVKQIKGYNLRDVRKIEQDLEKITIKEINAKNGERIKNYDTEEDSTYLALSLETCIKIATGQIITDHVKMMNKITYLNIMRTRKYKRKEEERIPWYSNKINTYYLVKDISIQKYDKAFRYLVTTNLDLSDVLVLDKRAYETYLEYGHLPYKISLRLEKNGEEEFSLPVISIESLTESKNKYYTRYLKNLGIIELIVDGWKIAELRFKENEKMDDTLEITKIEIASDKEKAELVAVELLKTLSENHKKILNIKKIILNDRLDKAIQKNEEFVYNKATNTYILN